MSTYIYTHIHTFINVPGRRRAVVQRNPFGQARAG